MYYSDFTSLTTTATCPFCGSRLVLGECPIVATELELTNGLGWSDDSEAAPTVTPVSGAHVLAMAGDWPVVAKAPLAAHRQTYGSAWSKVRGRRQRLPHPDELAPLEDLPARVCTSCNSPLPLDVDDRELLTIAVVGMTGATKTHYLASMVHSAYHGQALADPLGCSEFAPDEPTAQRFQRDYYRALFGGGELLRSTPPPSGDTPRVPLAFRATFPESGRLTLLFDDIAGEVLTDRARRNRHAAFVRKADGVIFLIDPSWFPAVSSYLQERHGIPPQPPVFDQAALIDAVADEVARSAQLERIPFAIALSKADLLPGALGRKLPFGSAPPTNRAAWVEEMNELSDDVEALIADDLSASSLLAAAARLPNTTYHAVAPLGFQPTADGFSPVDLQPQRCLDPLFSVLVRLGLGI